MGDEVTKALASLQGLADQLQQDGTVQAIEDGVEQLIERLDVLRRATEVAGWNIVCDFVR